MHFLRAFFLTLSLCALGVAWIRTAQPGWIASLDRWLCDQHIQESRELWERVSAAEGLDNAPSIEAVENHLTDLGEVWLVERRFPLWKKLTTWLVAQLETRGDFERACFWQGRLLEVTPNDLESTLHMASLLVDKGNTEDLHDAELVLQGLRQRMPEWKAVEALELRLAERMAMDERNSQPHGFLPRGSNQ